MRLDRRLVDVAIAFTEKRFPGEIQAGAAAMYCEDGEILVSTAIAVLNESVALCHETDMPDFFGPSETRKWRAWSGGIDPSRTAR